MLGITFNKEHSFKDYGLDIVERKWNIPTKRKTTVEIPYVNGVYDFSLINGEQTYSDRQITYTFGFKEMDNYKQIHRTASIENWLYSAGGKEKLIDDRDMDFYFLAECTEVSPVKQGKITTIEATFTAYPFRISQSWSSDPDWDSFNFLTDCLQETKYQVKKECVVELYNYCPCSLSLSFYCSAGFTITINGTTYNLSTGATKDTQIMLKPGQNSITVQGTGEIEFFYRNEVV